MTKVKTLGLLGTGVIGGGWAARALHFGIDVIAADVKPEMEAWIRGAVANAEPALARLTFAPLPPKGTLSFTTDLRTMAERADFIQENIPEQLPLKQRMLAEVSRSRGRGRHHRVEYLGPHSDRSAARHGGPRTVSRGASVQSGLPAAAGGTRGRRANRARHHRRCGRILRLHRNACAASAARSARPLDRSTAGGDLARNPPYGQRRRRDHR